MTEPIVITDKPSDRVQAIYEVVHETFKKLISESSHKTREKMLIDMDEKLESLREEMPMHEFMAIRANATTIAFKRVSSAVRRKSHQPSEEVLCLESTPKKKSLMKSVAHYFKSLAAKLKKSI